jgi:hypothetical protein
MSDIKKTVGQQIIENATNKDTGNIPVMELAAAMCEDYMPKLMRTIDEQCQYTKEDFYIEVLQKHERILEKAFRPHIMICHSACPKPNPDQSLFRYNQKDGRIELIWVLPPQDAIIYLLQNYKHVHKDEQQLLNYCVMYARGDLWHLMKKFNGENELTPELDNKKIILGA